MSTTTANTATTLRPLLNRPAVATALAVSLRTVDTLIANGSLRVVRLGKSVRIRQEDIEALLEGAR
jgi:excisionase family DNA binding protein